MSKGAKIGWYTVVFVIVLAITFLIWNVTGLIFGPGFDSS